MDLYTGANEIYGLKQRWANTQDEAEKRRIEKEAQDLYKNLRDNGYGKMAEELQASDAQRAMNLVNSIGKSTFRDYVSQSPYLQGKDLNDLVKWDELTGTVSFGGKNIGKPAAVVDGVSYWDPKVLDAEVADLIKRAGMTLTDQQTSDMAKQAALDRAVALLNSDIAADPYSSQMGKDILAQYTMAGLQAGDNAAAAAAATNGGNIDSFAAANAARQNAILKGMGVEKLLEAQQQTIDKALDLLNNAGARIDSDRKATREKQLNDSNIRTQDSNTLGYATDDLLRASNPYLNEDGTVKDSGINYQQEIDRLTEQEQNAATPQEARRLGIQKAYLVQARNEKLKNDSYGAYRGQGTTVMPIVETSDVIQNREALDANERMNAYNADTGLQGTIYKADSDYAAKVYDSDSDLQGVIYKTNASGSKSSGTGRTNSGGGKKTVTYGAILQQMQASDDPAAVLNSYMNDLNRTDYNALTKELANMPSAEAGHAPGEDINALSALSNTIGDKDAARYIKEKLIPLLKSTEITETQLHNNMLDNSSTYDLEVKHMKAICDTLGLDTVWLDDYKNAGLFGWGSGVKKK